MLPSVREDDHFVEGSDAILAKSAALHCLYCQGVFLRKIRPDIGTRVHLLEGRVHDGQPLEEVAHLGNVHQLTRIVVVAIHHQTRAGRVGVESWAGILTQS